MTTVPTPHLDGKHVVFGEVVDGKGIIRKIENLKTQNDKPQKDATIIGIHAKHFRVLKSLLMTYRLRPTYRQHKDWREGC